MTVGRRPKSLERLDFGPARQQFQQWMSDDYDVAVYMDPVCHAAFGTLVDAPAIVDLDDVPDLLAMREFRVDQQAAGLRRPLPRQTLRSARGRIEIRRWRASRPISRRTRCGDSSVPTMTAGTWEATVSRWSRTRMNGRGRLVGDSTFRHRPRSCSKDGSIIDPMQMPSPTWRPSSSHGSGNRFPGTGLVVAGPIGAQAAASLSELEGVRVLGFVPHIEDALELADLIAVPLRLGGGTRIKILEAFAHRIPGSSPPRSEREGLNVEAGRELLVADDPDDFRRIIVLALPRIGRCVSNHGGGIRPSQTEQCSRGHAAQLAELVQGVRGGVSGAARPDPCPSNGLQFGA